MSCAISSVVGSSLARGKIFTYSIGSVDSLYPSVFIYCMNLHQFLILCSSKAMMFPHFWYLSNFACIIGSIRNRCHPLKRNQYTTCTASDVVNISAGVVLGGDVMVMGSSLARGKLFWLIHYPLWVRVSLEVNYFDWFIILYKHKILPSALYIMWPMHLQILKLGRPTV